MLLKSGGSTDSALFHTAVPTVNGRATCNITHISTFPHEPALSTRAERGRAAQTVWWVQGRIDSEELRVKSPRRRDAAPRSRFKCWIARAPARRTDLDCLPSEGVVPGERRGGEAQSRAGGEAAILNAPRHEAGRALMTTDLSERALSREARSDGALGRYLSCSLV